MSDGLDDMAWDQDDGWDGMTWMEECTIWFDMGLGALDRSVLRD